MQYRYWTPEEHVKLRRMLPRCSIAAIAKSLNRNKRSVYEMIVRAGLQFEAYHYRRADKRAGIVQKLRKSGATYSYIADIIGTSVGRASRIGRDIGFKSR